MFKDKLELAIEYFMEKEGMKWCEECKRWEKNNYHDDD